MTDPNGPVLPVHSPVYGPPPYDMTDATMVFVNFSADPDALESVVPAPLELAEGDCTAVVSDLVQLPHCGWFFEGSLRVPVRFGDVTSSYTPHLWCSEDEPILVGREVYGMPKVLCDRTELRRTGNQIGAEVRRRGELVMRVSVNIERRGDPTAFAAPSSRLTVRSFLSPDPSRPHYREVLQVPLVDYEILEVWEGTGTVELRDTAFMSPGRLSPTVVGTGYFLRGGWRLGGATSLWSNYQPV